MAINIKVRNRIASSDASIYVCGNNDFTVNFDFDDEWDEFVHKTARFVYNDTYTDVVFSGNLCAVPVISDARNVLVGVYAGDLRTTTPAIVAARKSILCETHAPAEPTPDVYAQMVELFNAGLDESRINANAAETAKNTAVEAQEIAEISARSASGCAEAAKASETNSKASEANAKASEEEAAKSKADAEKAKKSAAINASVAETASNTSYQFMLSAQQARDSATASATSAADHAAAAEMAAGSVAGDASRAAECAGRAEMYAGVANDYANFAEQSAATAKASEEAAREHATTAEMYTSVASMHASDAKASAEAAEAAKTTSLQALDALLMVDAVTGKVATTECAAAMPIRKLTVNDDTAVEAVKIIGKNFFNRDYEKTNTHLGVTFSWDAENQEIVMNGTTTGSGDLKLVEPLKLDWVAGEKYTITVTPVGGTATLNSTEAGTNFGWGIFQNNAAKYIRGQLHYTNLNVPYSFTGTAFALDASKHYIFYFQCWRPGTVFDNYRVKVQIERGTSVTEWEAYREESVAIADLNALPLHKGTNNVIPSPSADISVEYNVDTKMYIDSRLAELEASVISLGGNV